MLIIQFIEAFRQMIASRRVVDGKVVMDLLGLTMRSDQTLDDLEIIEARLEAFMAGGQGGLEAFLALFEIERGMHTDPVDIKVVDSVLSGIVPGSEIIKGSWSMIGINLTDKNFEMGDVETFDGDDNNAIRN